MSLVTLQSAPALAQSPSKDECISADEDAQHLVHQDALLAARERLKSCLAEACPGPVRDDCAELSKTVEAALPSVVFELRDAQGKPLTNATITVDGKPAETADQTPITADPGEHRFSFEAPGSPRVSKTLTLERGQKARHEVIELVDRTGPALRTLGLAVAGVGVVSLGAGVFLGIEAKATYDDARKHCTNGSLGCDAQGVNGGRDAHGQASDATTFFVLGSLLAGGGAALYFLVPRAHVTVSPAAGRGSLGLRASAVW